MKLLRGLLPALVLALLPAASLAGNAQSSTLMDGTPIFGYINRYDIPEAQRNYYDCDAYVYASPDFKPFPTGRAQLSNGATVLVEHGCLMHRTCEGKLNDGRSVEFFQQYVFDQADRAYILHSNQSIPLGDGHYRFMQGDEFDIANGTLPEGQNCRMNGEDASINDADLE